MSLIGTDSLPAENDPFFAEASDYASLKAAIRARVEQLNISRNCLDGVAGTTPGYAAKLLAPYHKKKIGQFSLGLLLQAAGLRMVLVDDPAAGKKGHGVSPSALDGLLKAAGLKMMLVDDPAALVKVRPMFEVRASNQVRLNNRSRRGAGQRSEANAA
ncbi:hypothetical protein [Bradyrhizobium diazoefficiens]|uniref:hypothetical protein n=1 Tax=Bradyrhizobium diazoefficiens TaxID=1355477 RepID=UPI0034988564